MPPRKKSAAQLDREIATVLSKKPRKRKVEDPYAISTRRLKSLRSAMEDAEGDEAWRDADLEKLGGWVYAYVDDSLSDDAWESEAMRHLQDDSVRPEHLGAPSPNVYAWNDAFISTYQMNIDDGMSREDAIDSARQNAADTVKLTASEWTQVKTDPALYKGQS